MNSIERRMTRSMTAATPNKITFNPLHKGADDVVETPKKRQSKHNATTPGRSARKTPSKKLLKPLTSTSLKRRQRLQQDEVLISLLEEPDGNYQTFDWNIKNSGLFLDKWFLLEKMNNIEHSSPVYRVMRKDGTYGDLRFFTRDEIPKMNMEILCLDKMERYGKSSMFRRICDFDIVNSEKEGFYSYVVTFHKPGYAIEDLLKLLGTFSIESGTRIGLDIIEIVENLSKAKLLMTDIRPEFFAIDQNSGKVFLSNATKIIYNSELGAMSNKFRAPKWDGLDIYAPLNSHINPQSPMCEADFIESAFYVYLHMIGYLPWAADQSNMISKKERWRVSVFQELHSDNIPEPLITCLLVIQRGQALDINREHTMKNGLLIFHQYRHHVYKRKALATSSFIDYNTIYTCLRNFAGKGIIDEALPLPSCLNLTPNNNNKAALVNALMNTKMEIEAVNIEINQLKQTLKNSETHKAQLSAEISRNVKYIQRFVFDDTQTKDKQKGELFA